MAQVQTIREFLILLSQTEIKEARDWLLAFDEVIPHGFDTCAITEESVMGIAWWLQSRISSHLRQPEVVLNTALYKTTFLAGHEFLREIHQKAVKLGIEVGLKVIDSILAKKPEDLE